MFVPMQMPSPASSGKPKSKSSLKAEFKAWRDHHEELNKFFEEITKKEKDKKDKDEAKKKESEKGSKFFKNMSTAQAVLLVTFAQPFVGLMMYSMYAALGAAIMSMFKAT